MNRFQSTISLSLVLSLAHLVAISQTIPIDPGETPLSVLMTPILSQDREILPAIQTNLRGRVGISTIGTSLSNDGSIAIIEGNLILRQEVSVNAFSRINYQLPNDEWVVSGNGEWLPRLTYDDESQSIVQFYNTMNFEMMHEYRISNYPIDSLVFSDDSSVFLFIIDQPRQVHVVERKDSIFASFVLINEGGAVNLSSKGDRVFFYGGNVHQGFRYLQFDRLLEGWSEPRELVLRDEQGQAFDFVIRDIANNGRTILFITGTRSDFDLDRKLGIVHEINSVWSVPQILDFRLTLGSGNNYRISEDGKVVAVQSAITDLGNNTHSDIFVFIQSPNGEWVKHQVNPPGVLSLSGMLLTKDGTKLFWMPTSNFLSSAPFAP